MKKLMFCLSFLVIVMCACTSTQKQKMMSITTNSETALKHYKDAINALQQINLRKFSSTMKEALKEDPDFFMANFQMTMINIFLNNKENIEKYKSSAINCKAKLSEEENMLREALLKLSEDKISDAVEIGKKLTKQFPDDEFAWFNLLSFQMINKDHNGAIETTNKMIPLAKNKGYLYNNLGYSYLNLKQYDNAKQAFDKYIELEPTNPNAYDSKGDYCMEVKEYNNAYDLFMKAHSIDTLWNTKKALKAKHFADSLAKK